MAVSPSEIQTLYRALLRYWGPQNWWPAQSRFEVIVGAYLTQNTNWSNVEKALANLRRARVLSVKGIRQITAERLEELVRPSGYFRQKALRLKTFIAFLDAKYSGSLDRMFAQSTQQLRTELLELNGVGPETADSILLYAGNHPIFVVDAYTRRVLERHGLIAAHAGYEDIRALVENALERFAPDIPAIQQPGVQMFGVQPFGVKPRHKSSRMSRASRSALAQHYNEFHALIVRAGNQSCRTVPQCEGCPLKIFLPQVACATTETEAATHHRKEI